MPEPTPQVLASRQLLQEVCRLLAPFRGIPALAAEFATLIDDPPVRAVLTKLAGKFRDEEDSGPRDVVEVEEPMGEARAIRKFAVFTNVDDFLRAVGIVV
jgi:hypothetical protein